MSGHLCVRRPWPGMARSIYGDHERFLDTYYRPYPGTYNYWVGVWGGRGWIRCVHTCVCVCVHALFVVDLLLHYILVPGGGLTLKLKVNIHVYTCTSAGHCCIHVDILCIQVNNKFERVYNPYIEKF